MTNASKKIINFVVGGVIIFSFGGLLYISYPKTTEDVAADITENYPPKQPDVTPISLTDLKENITPQPVVEKVEPAFDPTGGHSPDTHLAIVRFCNAMAVETSWSIDVDTVGRYYSPNLDNEVLVLTYITGDWLILSRSSNGSCYPIGAEMLDDGLQTITDLTPAKL